jgi:hypothetical protein
MIGVIATAKNPQIDGNHHNELVAYLNANLDQTEPAALTLREKNSSAMQPCSSHFPNKGLLIVSRSVLQFPLNSFNFTKAECWITEILNIRTKS